MSANIDINAKLAVFKGVPSLKSASVEGKDLRSAAALILAALTAEGVSEVRGLGHLDRGYENLEDKFIKLGATIKRVSSAENLTLSEDEKATN